MTVQRWNCTSYCLCGSRNGHFEAASEDGVWVVYSDHEAEVTQLRGNLSLAEEGLANATQENERLKTLLRRWQYDVGGAMEWLERDTVAAIK